MISANILDSPLDLMIYLKLRMKNFKITYGFQIIAFIDFTHSSQVSLDLDGFEATCLSWFQSVTSILVKTDGYTLTQIADPGNLGFLFCSISRFV